MLETILLWSLIIAAVIFLGPFVLGTLLAVVFALFALILAVLSIALFVIYIVGYSAVYPFRKLYRLFK